MKSFVDVSRNRGGFSKEPLVAEGIKSINCFFIFYAVLSVIKGAAGGPIIVKIPGPEGIVSPIRTNGCPLIFTWLGDNGPIGSG
jgi:hypothetical protein